MSLVSVRTYKILCIGSYIISLYNIYPVFNCAGEAKGNFLFHVILCMPLESALASTYSVAITLRKSTAFV